LTMASLRTRVRYGGDDPTRQIDSASGPTKPPADPLAGRKKAWINQILFRGKRRSSLDDGGGGHDRRRSAVEVVALLLVLALMSLAFPNVKHNGVRGDSSRSEPISYSCPASISKSLNDVGNNFDVYTADIRRSSFRRNDTSLTLDHIRSRPMDGWGIPYHSVKEGLLRPWKEEAFVPNLKSGDSLYESACGAGLNLLLTAEIMAENGIHNLTVYGNDYMSESVEIANWIWKGGVSVGWSLPARGGTICAGDSSDLSFVPSSSFDLAYTGYIDPLNDPLNLLSESADANARRRNSIKNCRSTDPEEAKLAEEEQRKQEEWHASWVKELIRIAKPGKSVVIESICESLCKHYREKPTVPDWGGVDKDWWERAVSTYGWDVSDIFIRDAPVTKEWKYPRYHVVMKKKMK